MKKKILTGILCVVLLGGLACSGVYVGGLLNQKAKLESQLAEQQTQTTQAKASASSTNQKMISEVTGLDTARVASDNKVADDFFRTIFAWKGGEQYEEARQYCIEKGISEDSPFLTEFFAPINLHEDYDPLDKGGSPLSMYFGKTDYRKVTSIKDDVYSYFAVVTVTSDATYKTQNGEEKKVEGSGRVVLTYDMDKDGNIKNLDGYTIPGQ